MKQILVVLLLLTLTIGGGNFFWNARLLMQQGQQAAQNVKNSTARADDYLNKQITMLESEQYQTLMRNNLAAGSYLQSITNSINTKTLPLINRNLASSNDLILALNANTRTLDTLIVNLDRQINTALLPQATALLAALTEDAHRFGLSLDAFNKMLVAVSEKANLTLDEVLSLVASPEWKLALQGLNLTMANVASATAKADASMEQIRLAMLKAPSIAESLEKIAKTSSKFTKATLVAGIISALARAFLP